MISDVLKGLQYIHSAGIVHRDLKSPNLLVDKSWKIKIADFGMSAFKKTLPTDGQISLLWTAPEILMKSKNCYTEKSDIYSLSIIIWEMLARDTPYTGVVNTAAITPWVVQGRRPMVSHDWSPPLSSLMQRSWALQPDDRPTIIEARKVVDNIYVDPTFQIGSSSTMEKYVSKPAPPPSGFINFVSTIVSHTTELWEHDPHAMKRALLLHCDLVRKLMIQEKGYEVKCNGDSFLVAFVSTTQAARFALKVQSELMHAEWPESLLRHPTAAPQKNKQGELYHRGLHLQVGVHITQAVAERAADKMDYRGSEVNTSAKLASIAPPGSILISVDIYYLVMSDLANLDPLKMENVGAKQLKKEAEPLNMYMMIPEAVADRQISKEDINYDAIYKTVVPNGFEFPEPHERWVLKRDELEIGTRIGVGSFGEVRDGTWNGNKVAIKLLVRQTVPAAARIELYAESALLSSLDHRNVLKFMGMCFQHPTVCLVTEYMEKGSLSNILYSNASSLTWKVKVNMLIDIAKGMKYLHSRNIIHRDIKSSNMLVAADDTVKIADFGFSRVKAENQTMTQCGTVAWTAPEIFDGGKYTEKADVYSYGVVIWEMIFCKKPWDGIHAMKLTSNVIAGQRPSTSNMPSNTPKKVSSLMELCWRQSPVERPSFDSIISKLSFDELQIE